VASRALTFCKWASHSCDGAAPVPLRLVWRFRLGAGCGRPVASRMACCLQHRCHHSADSTVRVQAQQLASGCSGLVATVFLEPLASYATGQRVDNNPLATTCSSGVSTIRHHRSKYRANSVQRHECPHTLPCRAAGCTMSLDAEDPVVVCEEPLT
jgi:hypothetical protein